MAETTQAMPKSLAREILTKRGRRHYPGEDFETIIQLIMDDYDPESHFGEQMRDFLANHPEYAPWHMLFISSSEGAAEDTYAARDWKNERLAWVETEATSEGSPHQEEARKMFNDLLTEDLVRRELCRALLRYHPTRLKIF